MARMAKQATKAQGDFTESHFRISIQKSSGQDPKGPS
jgi:hypothetical protein